MYYLTYKKFYSIEEAVETIRKNKITNNHALLFTNFPVHDDELIIDLSRRLGKLSEDGIKSESNELVEGIIHNVEDRRGISLDPFGNQITSTTNQKLDFHSDEYFSLSPATLVLLACVRQAATGGTSRVVSLDTIIDNLSDKSLELLRRSDFPCHIGSQPVLIFESGHFKIRFNRLEMERAKEIVEGTSLSKEQLIAVDELEEIAVRESCVFRMTAGQLLVLNNRRSLHARTSFPRGDRRLLKRVRVK